jgi:putative DNA primase/helicase
MAQPGTDTHNDPSNNSDYAAVRKGGNQETDGDFACLTPRTVPEPDPACLYGLVGDVARAGSDGTETNPYAIAANFMAYLSCAVGRTAYLPIGNTWHHARLFFLHIGRSGRGRKGDALSLVLRIDESLRERKGRQAPQVHRGGLSTREGLIALIHDGYKQGRTTADPIVDKRLWVVESEFSNVLHQGRRDGNTLSAALRDCWDGISLKPATKTNRQYASNPHVCISGAISPEELLSLMKSRDLTNGFANRFLMIWAERTKVLPFPKATGQSKVEELTGQTAEVLKFLKSEQPICSDAVRMEMSPQAQWRYGKLYRAELNAETGSALLGSLLERQAPMLLRLAMLFALTDMRTTIDVQHIDAAAAWMRYGAASAKFVFLSADQELKLIQTQKVATKLTSYLQRVKVATRKQISDECFQRHETKSRIDAALDFLASQTPPKIRIESIARAGGNPGRPTEVIGLPGFLED